VSPRVARSCHGSEHVLKRLPGEEAVLRLAQISVRGFPLSPEIGELANRAGGLEPVEAQRSEDVGNGLSAIDHGIDFA
jgi:hypothetical protein